MIRLLVRINRHFVKYRPFEAVFLYAALENFDCYLAGGLYYNHNQTRPLNGLVLESVNSYYHVSPHALAFAFARL
ncbi:hypothetical protein PMAL9190_02516 [Photobacterium malacitanum]|uniref:Uncharacterized protein n=1 Tax=Photobacterium malacitanum TaxID=2204294 RepID=A0A1Y6MJR0_9GAMM|nr:hypothetical protein PMAL9190_02516 [Photobacterium malacitanum]